MICFSFMNRKDGGILANHNDAKKSLIAYIKKLLPDFSILIGYIRSAVSTVTELDTILRDLRKTTDLSTRELERFYDASQDIAKQMGTSTKDVLTQAAAWSRLGFHSAEAATQMAKLSSQFALLSPGMSPDETTTGLAGIMKAYDMEVGDVLDGILSKINAVGNSFSLTNTDIMAMLQDSVSVMAASGNSLEETISLEAAAFEGTRDQNVGNDLKTAALRLRSLNEETQETDKSLQNLKNDLYDLTGVSVMADADTYKSTYQVLKEISTVWDSLSDQSQGDTLTLLFGKQSSDAGASILDNFNAVEMAMAEMSDSAGNADAAMAAATDSIAFKLNALSETGTGIAENLFQGDEMKTVLDFLTSLAEGLDWVTDKLGLFGTAALGIGAFTGFQNIGKSIRVYGLQNNANLF